MGGVWGGVKGGVHMPELFGHLNILAIVIILYNI